jgi:hypothetical protein
MVALEVGIRGTTLSPQELRAALAEHIGDAAVELDVRESVSQYRAGADPAVVVAVLGGGATVLSALITGIFALLAARPGIGRKIVIKGKDGASVECPADTPLEVIPQLVELARQLDTPSIEVDP